MPLEEPPSHNLSNSLTSPELYALGFAFSILFLSIIVLGVLEVILLRVRNTSSEIGKDLSNHYLKYIHDHIRLYSTTWVIIESLINVSTIVVLGILIRFYLVDDHVWLSALYTLLCLVFISAVIRTAVNGYVVTHLERYVKLFARLLRTLVSIFRPISIPLMDLDSRLNKTINKPEQLREKLSDALARAVKVEGESDKNGEILKGIVTFSLLRVKDVMRNRPEIAALNIGLNFHELLQKTNTYGYSRIPVFKNLTDQLEGVLYTKDLLPFLEKEATFQWQKLLRPGFFVPENKRLDSLLKEFQEKRIHIALVTNDQKRVTGIITMEDVIEEIIGDINDEFDEVNAKQS